jgi:hypothetical protein
VEQERLARHRAESLTSMCVVWFCPWHADDVCIYLGVVLWYVFVGYTCVV